MLRTPSDRAAVLCWMRNLYIAVSIPVLVWLVMVTAGGISRGRQLEQAVADQVTQYIKGAVQQTERVVAAVEQQSAAAGIRERLVRAEVAVHELHLSLLWYAQTQRSAVAYSFVAAYSEELRMMHERLGQTGGVSAADRQLLGDIAHDLQLIERLYTRDALRQSEPQALAAIRQQLREELRYDVARELILPAP